jgi:hypothetical protein
MKRDLVIITLVDVANLRKFISALATNKIYYIYNASNDTILVPTLGGASTEEVADYMHEVIIGNDIDFKSIVVENNFDLNNIF